MSTLICFFFMAVKETKQDLTTLMDHPLLAASSISFAGRPVVDVSTSRQSDSPSTHNCVYVFQREYAVVDPELVKVDMFFFCSIHSLVPLLCVDIGVLTVCWVRWGYYLRLSCYPKPRIWNVRRVVDLLHFFLTFFFCCKFVETFCIALKYCLSSLSVCLIIRDGDYGMWKQLLNCFLPFFFLHFSWDI